MYCSKCGSLEDKVIDSRLAKDGRSIRRRRECITCGHRYTTYEELERADLRVVKRDGRSEPFDRHKLQTGMVKACEKRPVSVETIEVAAGEIIRDIEADFPKEIPSMRCSATARFMSSTETGAAGGPNLPLSRRTSPAGGNNRTPSASSTKRSTEP